MDSLDLFFKKYAYKFPKGYPDLTNEQDINLLADLLENVGINLEEKEQMSLDFPKGVEKDTIIYPTVTNEDIQKLKEIFEKISKEYGKYLSVFNLFDPNALGTISEVLLAKLISKEGVKVEHVGGQQGLTDLIINGHRISLKTSGSENKIKLGSSTEATDDSASKEIASILKNNNITNTQIKDLESVLSKEQYNTIIKRLEAIAKKLTGEGNEEFFIWVEKINDKSTGIIKSLNIHIIKYDYEKVMDTFKNGYISSTEKSGWGITDKNGKSIVAADLGNRSLNVTPYFINNSSNDSVISVDLKTSKLPKQDLSSLASDKMFKSLDTIYNDIFSD
jgi:uncharacterized protein related to proFAR isomerase